MRSQRRLTRSQTIQQTPTAFLFDTSGNFSQSEKFTMEVKRSTDNVIRVFSPLELRNGSYTTWLNGAIGYLNKWKEEELRIADLYSVSNVELVNLGVKIPTQGVMRSAWSTELNDNFIANYVINNVIGGVQTYDFGAYTNLTGFSFSMFHTTTTYRKKLFNGTIKTINFPQHNFQFTANSYDDTIKNVFTVECVNGVCVKMLVNGISTTVFSAGDTNASLPQFGSNTLSIGNRPNPYSRTSSHYHDSLYFNPTKTSIEYHNELISIFQT